MKNTIVGSPAGKTSSTSLLGWMNFGGHVESMMQNDLPLSIYRSIKSHRACWQPNTTLVNASTMFAMEHICSPSLAAKLFIRRQNTFGEKFCLCQPPYLSGTGGLFYSEMRLTRNQLATVAGAFDAQTAIDRLSRVWDSGNKWWHLQNETSKDRHHGDHKKMVIVDALYVLL
jgi:hypothetical protein